MSDQEARRQAEQAEAERDALAQAMWEARAILGFDNDGDKTPAATIAGMGWEGYRVAFLDDVRRQAKDYQEALEEIPG